MKVTDFTFYGEVIILLWLLVRGINNQQPDQNIPKTNQIVPSSKNLKIY